MANIKDVAHSAGVSPITVSRVFNHPELVSKKTVDAVKKASEDLSYAPNLLARGLVTNKTQTIGVFFSRLENPLYSACLSGITESAAAAGYNVLIAYADSVEESIKAIQVLMSKQIDGLILMSVDFRTKEDNGISQTEIDDLYEFYHQFDIIAERCYQQNFPIVYMSQLDGKDVTYSAGYVAHDYAAGSLMAVQYLVQKGHQKIGYLAHVITDEGLWGIRYRAFFDAIKRLHCETRPEWICLSTDTVDGGFASMSELLKQKELPTAIYCANDEIAVGAINACHANGIRVPEDISIIGHDGSSIGNFSYPKLTTISIHYKDMGIECVNLLIEVMKNNQFSRTNKIMRPILVERDSVKSL